MSRPTPTFPESPGLALLPSSFALLPPALHERVAPTPVSRPALIRINHALAA